MYQEPMYPVRNRTGADYFVAAEYSRALTGVSSNHINGNGALSKVEK